MPTDLHSKYDRMKTKPTKRFYIDCTHTYFDRLNDGISRVTRNLIQQSDIIREMGSYEIHPIVFHNDKYYVLSSHEIFKGNPPEKYKISQKSNERLSWCIKKILSIVSITKKQRKAYRQRLKADRAARIEDLFPHPIKPFEESSLSKDDFLILPELCQENQLTHLIKFKGKLTMAFVIHDLIPITHPEYCGDSILFNRIFKFAAKNADIIIAVSKYSAACFNAYEKLLECSGESLNKKRITHFHLGHDLCAIDPPSRPSREIETIYRTNSPVFLVCGTIEPRKNHDLILNTFNKLWEQRGDVKLLFIGRYGWNSSHTLLAITQHPELGKRFFWVPKCTDADLHYAYQNCHALIFASQVEGFGLPLVEALTMGKEVLFSRIKSFQEIIPKEFFINSFDPNKPEELLDLVVKSLRTRNRLKVDKFKSISWRQSVKEFYRILLTNAGSPPTFQAKTLKRGRL